jgi:type II secretory pathway component GspD/PulD (secretin)
VIVSAPDENTQMIRELITQIDTSITDVTQTRIYRLAHADAVELADLVNSVYSEVGQAAQGQRGQRGQGQNPWGGGRGGGQQQPQQSGRALLQSRVTAVGDPRTNSIVVTAAAETMIDISEMVGRLDATDAKKQRVYVHALEHADAETVANVLRGLLGEGVTTPPINRLLERTNIGASMDSDQNSSGGIGSGGSRAR